MDSLAINKIKTLIQFAYKAKKLSFGESTIFGMMNNKVKILILATDVAPTQEKKYLSKASFYNTNVVRLFTKDELGEIFQKEAVACISINDKNMADAIKSYL